MSQKSFLYSSFNPFYPLKCVLGAGENELESVQRLAFLSMAITEDPQRRSEKLKQSERSVLAVLCEIIVSPFDPFYFYCYPFFCLFSPRLVCVHLCLALFIFFFSLLSFCMPIFSISFPILCHPPLFSSHLISSLQLLFWFI